MTTLRSFQSEIDDIQLAKQKVHTVSKPSKDKETPAVSKGKLKEAPSSVSKGKPKDGDPPVAGHHTNTDSESSLRANIIEEQSQLLGLIGSSAPADHDRARDQLASLITMHHGEYVLRIGEQPPLQSIFDSDIKDNSKGWVGTPCTQEEVEKLRLATTQLVEEVGGHTCILFDSKDSRPRVTLLLRLPSLDVSSTPEVRCAVVGNVDSGKSTILGVLTRGSLDDGKGRARISLFRHRHEIETGRTSSVGMEILGFDTTGMPILPLNVSKTHDPDVIRREKLGWEDISVRAAKIVSFIDLAGHERYLKTTLYGLTSGAPSCVILIVGANAGLIGMSKEHLAISLALNVPVVVCVTKIDMAPSNVLAETLKQVNKILKSPGCRKTPVLINSMESAIEMSLSFGKERLCPVFQVSNVTGEGLDYVRTFLNLLPSSERDSRKFSVDQPLEYSVTEIWSVPYVGTVVNGIVNSGTVKTGDMIMVGPDYNGNFFTTTVKDMQRKRATVKSADAGQCVSLALKRVRRADVRKGMVIVHKSDVPPRAVSRFKGQVLILYHNTTLQRNYQAMLHCGAVRQTVRILSMDHPQGVLRTGDRATVLFEFVSHPEFIKEGTKLLFREGKTKGLGVITELL